MKLTTDYDRDQQSAFRRRNRLAQELPPDKCPCELLAERIVQGDSPTQIHRWALHLQPPKFLKQLIASLSPPSTPQSALLLASGAQYSHSATQLWPASPGGGANVGGQFGQFSFDSLERSKAGQAGQGCEHRPLFLAILSAERGSGYFTLLQSWGISLWNVRDCRGQGPLHWAVQRQAFGLVQELVQLMPPGEQGGLARDRKGVSPLHLAASHRSARILKALLEGMEGKNLLLDAVDCEGMSPLHAAVGSEQCCELLLGPLLGMPVDLRDNQGRTPLHLAAWTRGASNVVRLLMAKKSIVATARDHQGLTPLHIAVMANNRPVLEALLEGMGTENGAQIFDHDSRTPLHYAALYDRTELARLLVVQAGTSNKTRDRYNVTPAHYAAQCASYQTLCAILGEEVGEEGGGAADSEGRTPFMWAVVGQNEPLLANKVDASRVLAMKDNFERNCLHLAALSGGMEMCKLLVEESNSALNMEQDENGATAEHLAAGQGNSELVLWFGYQRGHLAPPLDHRDRTPFFYACLGGQVSTIEAMVPFPQGGANPIQRFPLSHSISVLCTSIPLMLTISAALPSIVPSFLAR